MNEITTINEDNYASMAKAMGLPTPSVNTQKKASLLNRFRVWHNPTMGKKKLDGKEFNTEVVEGGLFRLEVVGDPSTFYFAEKVKIRPFMQRFMYKRFIMGVGDIPNAYNKTIMADTLNIDLKDDAGTFNCGKPAGYVEDFQALPEGTKKLIKSIKRNRVIFGIAELINPVQGIDGEEVKDLPSFPIIWEIDNRDAFKSLGDIFTKLSKMERLPLQHMINLDGTKSFSTNNGSKYYIPNVNLDLTKKLEIVEEDHKTFGDFMDWVKVYNDGIVKKWDEKVSIRQDEVSEEDMNTVEAFIDVEMEDANA